MWVQRNRTRISERIQENLTKGIRSSYQCPPILREEISESGSFPANLSAESRNEVAREIRQVCEAVGTQDGSGSSHWSTVGVAIAAYQ